MELVVNREQERLQSIADEYRNKGYEVILQPDSSQLPEFLHPYQPDLIAQMGEETIIIEVKSRRSLAQAPWVREMARSILEKEGWKFELVLVGSEAEISVSEKAHPLNEKEIFQSLEQAQELFEAGFTGASLLQAWSATEAGLRLLAQREGLEAYPTSPAQLVKSLVTEGVISRAEYELLTDVMNLRNALAHGYNVEDYDSAIVTQLINVVFHLLKAQPEA
jgi:hypothetical protein